MSNYNLLYSSAARPLFASVRAERSPPYIFWMHRSFALDERGLSASSRSEQVSGFLVRIFAFGFFPQMQTGADGGQVQGFSNRRNACLMIRSSNE